MSIRLKLTNLVLTICMAAILTGCSAIKGIFVRDSKENQSRGYDVISVGRVEDTKNNCFYVEKKDGTYQQLYLGKATFYSGNNYVSRDSVAWFGKDYARIPTMNAGEKIVYRSRNEFDEVFPVERFEDLGFTIGICKLTQSGSGRYKFSTNREDMQINPDSSAAALYELGEHTATMEQIGGIQLRSGNISRAGTIIGLEAGRSYKTDVYVGTSVNNYSLIADVKAFTSMESYTITKYDYEQSHVISFGFPNGFESGYYFVGGFGFVRYINSDREFSESMDMNIPAGTGVGKNGERENEEAEKPAGNVKKVDSFRLDSNGPKKVIVTYSEGNKDDQSEAIAPPVARIFGEDVVYTLSKDPDMPNTLSGVFDFKAGDYTIEVSGLYLRDYEYKIIKSEDADG